MSAAQGQLSPPGQPATCRLLPPAWGRADACFAVACCNFSAVPSFAGMLLQALGALLLATGIRDLASKAAPAKPAVAAAPVAAAPPKTPSSLGPPLRGGRSLVVAPPTGGAEPSPAAAASSAGRPSPYSSRLISTPEQLRRVLVRGGAVGWGFRARRVLGHMG